MAKITYASLKLKMNEEMVATKKFPEIMVKQYVSVSDLIDLVDIVLEKSFDGEIYNPAALDMYLHLGIVYLYTNITFTEKQREDEIKLYDTLLSNGVISEVLQYMNESDYERLCDYIEIAKKDAMKYKNTFMSMLNGIIDEIPNAVSQMNEVLKGSEIEKEYKKLIEQAIAQKAPIE